MAFSGKKSAPSGLKGKPGISKNSFSNGAVFVMMPHVDVLMHNLAIPTAVILAALIIQFVFTKTKGLHRTSKLVCPKCHQAFIYDWIPGGSFTAVRLGNNNRYMRCPKCHKWSLFDVGSTRIKSKEE